MSIILTTGRSGSTAVSQALALAPGCLSLSEALLSLEVLFLDPRTTLTGPDFARLLAEPTRTGVVMARHGLRTPEFWSGNLHRQRVPPLLVATLGQAGFPDPDATHLASIDWARAQGAAPVGAHVRSLFTWLCRRRGRSSWVERSGGSLFYAPETETLLPYEPVVVLLRDPLRTVQSMGNHLGFRFVAMRRELHRQLGYDPYQCDAPDDPPTGGLRAPYERLLPRTFDPQALQALDIPPEWFAMYWTRSVRRALPAVERGTSTIFWAEALAARPQAMLEQLTDALGLDDADGAWRATAAEVLTTAATSQAPPAIGDSPRLARLVRSALEAAVDLTGPDQRSQLPVVRA